MTVRRLWMSIRTSSRSLFVLAPALTNEWWIDYSGGEEVLLDVAGQDGTEAFEDVGHSDEAREILEGLAVGIVKRLVRTTFSHPLKQIQLLRFLYSEI